MRFSQAVSLSLVARAVLALVGFGTTALAARILEPEEFGAVIAVLAAIAVAMRVLSLGIGQAVQYFAAIERGGGRSYRGALLAATLVLILLALAAMPLLFGPAAVVLVGDSPTTKAVLSILAIGMPLSMAGFLSSLYYMGQRRFGLYYAAMAAPSLALAAFLGWTMVVGGGLDEVLGAYRAQFVVMALFALPMFWPLTSGAFIRESLTTDLREIGRYASKSYLIFITYFAVSRLSVFLGVHLTTLEDVGYLGVARTLSEATFQFYGAIGPVLLSYVGASKTGAALLLAQVSRLSFIVYCSMAVATIAVAWLLLGPIFGKAYLGALIPLCILLPGIVFSGLQHTFESYLYAIDRQGPVAFAHIAGAITMTAAAFLLAPRFGAVGLAAATTLNCLVAFAVTAFLLWRIERLTPLDTLIPRPGDLSLVVSTAKRLLTK